MMIQIKNMKNQNRKSIFGNKNSNLRKMKTNNYLNKNKC